MTAKDPGWLDSLLYSPARIELAMVSRKRSISDIQEGNSVGASLFDELSYRKKVLLLSDKQAEDDYDLQLTNEARSLGIIVKDLRQAPESIDSLAASVSLTTISSDHHNISSAHSHLSQSTVPTSCSSSEQQRPATHASHASSYTTTNATSPPTTPSVLSAASSSKRTKFGLKHGLKRLSTMKNRPLDDGLVLEVACVGDKKPTRTPLATLAQNKNRSRVSLSGSLRSLSSTKEKTPNVLDKESIQRSLDNGRLTGMRNEQSAAAIRFSMFEARAYALQKERHQGDLKRLVEEHKCLADLRRAENYQAEEELEERQLKAEEDLRNELEEQKRRAIIRLRHMEAYCNNPSSPSIEEGALPVPGHARRVSEADFKKVSQQYRLIKNMDTLHDAKINVLRGTQEQRAMQIITKHENTLQRMMSDWKAEEEEMERRQRGETAMLVSIFMGKKYRMIMRWRLAEEIERTKLERETGQKFGPLSPVIFPELEPELEPEPEPEPSTLEKNPAQEDEPEPEPESEIRSNSDLHTHSVLEVS